MSELMTFDRLTANAALGQTTDCIDASLLTVWNSIYPADLPVGDQLPVGMTAGIIMRAYLRVVSPRPPGNIHVGLDIRSHRAARLGEVISTSVCCADKEIRRDRRYVDFATRSTGNDDRLLFDGRLRLIWAA